MAVNPISSPLPADLPTNWQTGQTVAPNGSDVGLAQQYGYNYQSQQINAAQQAINAIGAQFPNLYGKGDTVPIANGGTGSDNAAQALVNLGAASQADLAALETQFQSDLEAAANELWEQVSDNTSKIATLWDAVFSNITGNPFTAAFTSLAGFNVTAGVYNATQKRLEC